MGLAGVVGRARVLAQGEAGIISSGVSDCEEHTA